MKKTIFVMKRMIFVLLFVLLLMIVCIALPTRTNPQTPSQTASIVVTSTPSITFTEMFTPFPASTVTPVPAASQQQGDFHIAHLHMIDANVGWGEGHVSSDGYHLLRTTDGGETWQDVTPPTRFSSPPWKADITIFAIDANTALAFPPEIFSSEGLPYVLVWRTTDGGKSWSPSNPIDVSDSLTLLDIGPRPQFVDEKHGWLTLYSAHRVDADYLKYRTSDGGVTWEEVESCHTWDGNMKGCDEPLFTDAQTGWLLGLPVHAANDDENKATTWRVRRTLDGGATWQAIDLPHSRQDLYCGEGFENVGDGTIGIRVHCYTPADEESYYYLSANRGKTWQIISLPKTFWKFGEAGEVFFLDLRTGWRLSTMDNGYQLERTLDGGVTWQMMVEHVDWKRVDWKGTFQFVDASTGWVINYSGDPLATHTTELQRTLDGGKTWVKLAARFLPAASDAPTIARLEVGHPLVFNSIRMIDSSNGWAVGADGYVFRTRDGGKTWQDVTPLHGYIFAPRELFALDAQRAWTAVSSPSSEMIWSTVDGGQSWHQIVTLPDKQILSPGSIRLLNENIGWFQSSQLNDNDKREVRLMKTRDNGVTWEIQSSGLYSYYAGDRMGFMFLDEQNGFRIEPVSGHTLEEFLSNSLTLISKTTDGGGTWQPVSLPPMVLAANEISLNRKAYPDGIQGLRQDTFSCEGGITLQAFSPDTLGLRMTCSGAYREDHNYASVVLSEYYLSTDSGASWNNWMSFGYDVSAADNETPVNSEFFLPDGTGWRLKTSQLLQTTDGGKSWVMLKAVGWDKAHFDFINAQEGWGIVKSEHTISFVHTTDGGKTWEEIKPVVAP